MVPSSTVENYLKALHDAEAGLATDALVPVGRLAARLEVTPGTATSMAKTLAEAGLVRYQPYLGLRLTRAGRKLAAAVVRRHRLVELFLVQVLGMNWSEVHEEADRLEHALSDRVIERMDALLGHPDVDPHGDPIPLADGTIPAVPDTTLLTCPLGRPVTVRRIVDQAPEFLGFAERHALVPGTEVRVESRDEAADRVDLRAGARRLVLGARAAMKVLVQVAGAGVLCALIADAAAAQAVTAAGLPAITTPAATAVHAVGGRVRHGLSGDPVADAVVRLDGTSWSARTGGDGSFTLVGVVTGRHTLVVRADGFLDLRRAIDVPGSGHAALDLPMDPVIQFTEAVSVSAETRSRFEAAQPIAVLSGQELSKQLEGTLGAALRGQLGVAERSSGPGASRPVIRGLDGDRVLILQDTHGMGDVSSQSADHGVTVNPAAASRIEVIRGPATLLYGSNAIGGLVNVVTNTIPTGQPTGGSSTSPRGQLTLDAGTGGAEAGAAAATGWRSGRLAVQLSGAARGSADTATPAGPVANTAARSAQGTIGASWVGETGYVGASYAFDDARYGLPAVEGTRIELTPRRHGVTARGEWRRLPRGLDSLRISAVRRAYAHDELEGGVVGTRFTNDVTEVTALVAHRPVGRIGGTIGASGSWRSFGATGTEALTPPVDQRSAALFFFEEAKWARVTAQAGARLERTAYRPAAGRPSRDFTDLSVSSGLVWRVTDPLTLAVSLASASRRPALEELYFDGLHLGNFAYEIGTATLGSERAFGADASVRWHLPRISGEITWFRNAIDGFVFREPTGVTVAGYPVVRFVARDSVLTGIEAKADLHLGSRVVAEVALDGTRGRLTATDEALPRIPPVRTRLGARVRHLAWQAGGEVTLTARQARVYRREAPTDGAAVLRLFSSWSFGRDARVHTVTVRLDNATDALYRNHLSYLKAVVAERGRSARVIYALGF